MADNFEPITTQEQFDNMIKSRLERERNTISKQFADYDDLKTANATLTKSLEELKKDKDDLSKQNETLNATISGLKTEEMKTKIAIEKGIPLEMRTRLTGSTEEEIRADAELLAKFVTKPSAPPLRSNEPSTGGSKEAAYKKMLSDLNL